MSSPTAKIEGQRWWKRLFSPHAQLQADLANIAKNSDGLVNICHLSVEDDETDGAPILPPIEDRARASRDRNREFDTRRRIETFVNSLVRLMRADALRHRSRRLVDRLGPDSLDVSTALTALAIDRWPGGRYDFSVCSRALDNDLNVAFPYGLLPLARVGESVWLGLCPGIVRCDGALPLWLWDSCWPSQRFLLVCRGDCALFLRSVASRGVPSLDSYSWVQGRIEQISAAASSRPNTMTSFRPGVYRWSEDEEVLMYREFSEDGRGTDVILSEEEIQTVEVFVWSIQDGFLKWDFFAKRDRELLRDPIDLNELPWQLSQGMNDDCAHLNGAQICESNEDALTVRISLPVGDEWWREEITMQRVATKLEDVLRCPPSMYRLDSHNSVHNGREEAT